MEEQDNNGGILRESLPQIVAVSAVVVVGACINIWLNTAIIQKDVANLVKSDASQNQDISQIKSDLNDLRVKMGVMKAVIDFRGR